jgi:TM2 domain-containing membrane protein YozV
MTEEMALGQSGLIDASTAAEVGNMLGAKLMLTGSVVMLGPQFSISCRITNVETSQLVATASMAWERGSLIMEAAKTQEINKHPITAGFKSLLIPGWGQIDNDQVGKGTFFMLLAGAGVLGAFYMNTTVNSYKIKYDNLGAGDASAPDKVYSDAQAYTNNRNYFIYGTAAVWGLGFMEAIFTAVRYNGKLSKGLAYGPSPGTTLPVTLTPLLAQPGVQVSFSF